jgi:hypothetical protein
MTFAVCYCCGNEKHGAFSICSNCGRKPQLEEDIVMSLAMTDHYFMREDIKRMGLRLRSGRSIELNEDAKEKFRETFRKSGFFKQPSFFDKLFGRKTPAIKKHEVQKFNLVAEWLHSNPLVLVGSEAYKIDESVFAFVLVSAKTTGWSGGDRFFKVLNQHDGVVLPFFTGAGVWEDEAIQLAICFLKFIKSVPDNDDAGDSIEIANTLIRLGSSGGFRIEADDI